MVDPQLQPEPLRPMDGRPYAEPQQPLDLRPRPAPRRPLDLRPRPADPQPLDVRPKGQPGGQPIRLPDPLGIPEGQNAIENAINNPFGYTPGKALTAPLGIADRARELNRELNTPDPLQTIDIPSIPLPDDSFPDLEETPTRKLPRDAIDEGPLQSGGGDASEANDPSGGVTTGGVPGVTYKVVLYNVRASVDYELFVGPSSWVVAPLLWSWVLCDGNAGHLSNV